MSENIEHLVDLRGLKCPMPVLHLQRHSRALQQTTKLHVLCDDPMAKIDVPLFLHDHGHQLIGVHEEASWLCFEIVLRVPSDASLA